MGTRRAPRATPESRAEAQRPGAATRCKAGRLARGPIRSSATSDAGRAPLSRRRHLEATRAHANGLDQVGECGWLNRCRWCDGCGWRAMQMGRRWCDRAPRYPARAHHSSGWHSALSRQVRARHGTTPALLLTRFRRRHRGTPCRPLPGRPLALPKLYAFAVAFGLLWAPQLARARLRL